MSERRILSIDCGTQSLRAVIFNECGDILCKEKIEYAEAYFSDRPGWAEQYAECYWNSLVTALKNLKRKVPEHFEGIEGVGVTTQRDTMICCDREGNPLRPAILWLDQRKSLPVYQPGLIKKRMFKWVGMDEAIRKTQADGKSNWIRQNEPDIWKNTHKYVQVSGFLNYKLTGKFCDSVASQIGHSPFNYRKKKWAKPHQMTAKLFPVEREKLVTVVDAGEPIGAVSRQASRDTGLSEGIPVIACGSDKGCETIGMGVIDESMASLSFGTTATIQTTSTKYFEPLKFMPPYPAPLKRSFNPEVEIFRGYWMINWFKREFGHVEVEKAKQGGVAPEQVLDEHLRQVPPGSMGLLLQPYWGPGLKNPYAKGAVIGFGDVHTRAYVYRAMIEGLAYALKEGKKKMERAGKLRFRQIAVSGGASQSDEICKITADVFNLPLLRGRTYESSSLGAAIITATGIGIFPTISDAISKMVHYGDQFVPNPENVSLYADLFNVYQKIYPALKPLYNEIREITGYPDRY